MPLTECSVDGKNGWKWGESGKCFTGPDGRAKALEQGKAIEASKSERVSNERLCKKSGGRSHDRSGANGLRCNCGTLPKLAHVGNAKRKLRPNISRSNPLKADPTRTKTLRRVFEQEVTRRIKSVGRAIVDLLDTEDAFGLKRKKVFVGNTDVEQTKRTTHDTSGFGSVNPRDLVGNSGDLGILLLGTPHNVIENQRFQFASTLQQKQAFERWLEDQLSGTLLQTREAYWEEFIRQGYAKGAGRAFDDTRAVQRATATTPQQIGFIEGSKQQFLLDAFGRPESIEKVQLLASRVFTDLKNVSSAMSTEMSRILVDGLAQGQHPREIAKAMVGPGSPLQRIGLVRARMIARSEIVRAHSEGQLDALEKLGVDKVGVMVEWSTAGDDRVCPLCQPLEGVVMTIKEARGVIPRHPNCVVGDSVIVADDVRALMKTHYTGEIIELVTAKGRRLSVTPNHILFTEYGFLPARFAYNGLKILDAVRTNSDVIVTPDDNSRKACIANIFTAFCEDSLMLSDSMPLAPKDLHGDGGSCNEEINIVRPNGELWRDMDIPITGLGKFEFPALQFISSESDLSVSSGSTQSLERMVRTFDSSMGVCRDLLALLLGHLLHTKIHGFATTPEHEPSIFQAFTDNVSTTSEFLRKSFYTHPILKKVYHLFIWDSSPTLVSQVHDFLTGKFQVALDSIAFDSVDLSENMARGAFPMQLDNTLQVGSDVVTSTSVSHVSGLPVYDVQTRSTVYQVNGLLTSNCRCTFVPANMGEGPDATRKVNFGEGVVEVGQVRGKKAIEASLRRSIDAERVKGSFASKLKKSTWVGADKIKARGTRKIAKVRPKPPVPPIEDPRPTIRRTEILRPGRVPIPPRISTRRITKPEVKIPDVVVEMPEKEASRWVKDNITKRRGDEALHDYLPDKTKQLLGDARASNDPTLQMRSAGLTIRGEDGPVINWFEGDLNVALHEIGHAIQYPGRRAIGNKFASSVVNPVDVRDLVEDAIKEYKVLTPTAGTDDYFGAMYLNSTGGQNEMWADLVSEYLNPRSTIRFRASMPKTWARMEQILGEIPDLPKTSSKMDNLLREVTANGHLKHRGREEFGLTATAYDQIADIVLEGTTPLKKTKIFSGTRKYLKNETKKLTERVGKAEAVLAKGAP